MRPAARRATVLISSVSAIAALTLGVTTAVASGSEPTQRPASRAAASAGGAGAAATSIVGTSLATTRTATTVLAPRISFAKLGVGFGPAVLVTNSGDGTGRLFIVNKTGLIFSWRPGFHPTVYLDLRARVRSSGDEQGLLGLTFYTDFKRVPLLWVSYTRSDNALQISRFLLSSYLQPAVNAATERPVLTVPHPLANHNGGELAFGNDGYLYISTGDGGGEGDPLYQAMRASSPLGKILRINASKACGGNNYCVPPTNPFAHVPTADPSVWEYGFRNPWRFSVDPLTGMLWIGDVGQNAWEEVDTAPAGEGGLNYGWSCMEGRVVYIAARCSSRVHYVMPYTTVPHNGGHRALIGGVVYRGTLYAKVMSGLYVFGDYVTGQIWTDPASGGIYRQAGSLPGVTSIGLDSNREIWATTLAGGVYRLTAS
jgi:glucose/arabinose dehydrogenase